MWYTQKTTWTGIAGVVSGVAGLLTGTMNMGEAVQLVVMSLIGIFLRQGLIKEGK